MIEVKVTCQCGQKYKFDVEPVNGQMPWRVNCPVCGADGTTAANMLIPQKLAAMGATQPAPAPVAVAAPAFSMPVAPPPLPVYAATPAPPPPPSTTVYQSAAPAYEAQAPAQRLSS